LHGALFEFFRNTNWTRKAISPLRRNNSTSTSLVVRLRYDPEGQDVLFCRLSRKAPGHGIPFTGLVPTQAMMNGDFSMDPLGLEPRGPNNSHGFGNIVNPGDNTAKFSPFMCNGAGNPIPADNNGHQTAVRPATRFRQLFDPIGHAMIQLYPQSNVVNASAVTTFLTFRAETRRKHVRHSLGP